MREILALGLDLGSTVVKAGLLEAGGRLTVVASSPAPALRGEGLVRECAPEEYLDVAVGVLQAARRRAPTGTPVGIATQRSTFAVLEARAGRFLTPLVSWQDRRAREWCVRHEALGAEVIERTGLLLSPHYLGPKLAAMQERDPALRAALSSGHARVGTLDTLLLARLSGGTLWQTDPTVASRTLLYDLDRQAWSPGLLASFEVPPATLAQLRPSSQRGILLEGGLRIEAALGDQPAGALAALDPGGGGALVTLGTGGFVLKPTGAARERREGYLAGPLPTRPGTATAYVLEGTVNGIGPAVDRLGPGTSALPADDPSPEAFALPDASGLGSPHWRPEIGLVLSPAARALPREGQRRVVLEGVLFRVKEILDGLGATPEVTVSGGLSRDPAVAPGLAALLGHPVRCTVEPEMILRGAALLAAGIPHPVDAPLLEVRPSAEGRYLREKEVRWRAWRDRLLSVPE